MKYLEVLGEKFWQRFVKRPVRREKQEKEGTQKLLEDRKKIKQGYEQGHRWGSDESRYRRWLRVYEYYREYNHQSYLEWQESVVLRKQEETRISPKMIQYYW